MGSLAPDQRNALYLQEAERAGLHKSILAALYLVQNQPTLKDGETGLGISPANHVKLDQVSTFEHQVVYAANTIRSLIDRLTAAGWQGADFWDSKQGRYSDKFIQALANGYAPPSTDTAAARLEISDHHRLLQAYTTDLAVDFATEQVPSDLAYLDRALLTLVERLPNYYNGLAYQRTALLEMVRLWRKLDHREAAIASLTVTPPPLSDPALVDESYLDPALLDFVKRASPNYSGYPHQREALMRIAQLWRQLDSREAAIASLAHDNTSPETGLNIVDPALIAFLSRLPAYYQSIGQQRHALVEGFRLWRQLDSRAAALAALGISVDIFSQTVAPTELAQLAAQLDRALLDFVRRVPYVYQGAAHQREALLRIVQLWRGITTRLQTIQTLFSDLQRMQTARPGSNDAPPKPTAIILPPRPSRWTLDTIQLHASIIPHGSFTWAEATHGGTRMPDNQATVDAIVQVATMAQQARDRIGRPFMITSWYRPADINAAVGGVSNSRHIVGDAIDFYCDGLTGDQIYWALDPWWSGGLGRYVNFPYLCHIDARRYRARWLR